MTDETVATVMVSLLESGVPTGPIAAAFDLDQTTVKELQAELRITKYGSAEIAELLTGLMFDAYAQARTQIYNGSPAAKTRMIQMIIGRGMALAGKQAPEEFERLRNQMMSLFLDTTSGESQTGLFPDPTFSPVEIDQEDEDE